MRPTKKLQIPSVEKKIPYQMCDFLAVTGLGFDDNEHQNFPKAPPRFPRKMTVKREDVVQVLNQSLGLCAESILVDLVHGFSGFDPHCCQKCDM